MACTVEFEIENIGVAPDVEVEEDPKAVATGHDPQLEKAVAIVMEELKKNPPSEFVTPPYPNYPQRTMGSGREVASCNAGRIRWGDASGLVHPKVE